ncbi:uncharacterized protein CANTADRAFT_92021 [Suhomyces tanzawaensis NRRL Y-17324]|uniref:Uncharacterized protein n=1 Tax=Suhomyces tanzawaensis NRRL Y-17324 TaxID=984487 RepID=A0A1E4SDP8_9ASCO|nr:uncharacterized protein CANTADRAFT_92021 [Suhomyces tanzawaensis NRRL Y-17324]ODV77598.1 hypothetical protein CANTADRAFT_92021 [Suhomyces tanzawaensis NRRL Y-17324]
MVERQASVILASTGERVRRPVSLSTSSFGSDATENDALLGRLTTSTSLVAISSRVKRLVASGVRLSSDHVFQSVLKCTIAYFIASLGVYWTRFDDFLGSTDSKHVVATVAVYFHPARSKGSMHQTLVFVVISLAFTFTVSVLCRTVSTTFFNQGEDEISHAIDVIISSIALGFIAFMKQQNNKANTACSLASISIITCIIKEGSLNAASIPLERLKATFAVVVVGCIISICVCYLVYPVSAVHQLRRSLNDSYNIMSSVLSLVSHRFLAGEKITANDAKAFDQLKSNISELLVNNDEAKFELRAKGREKEWLVFNELVSSTISLARHLQALRSSTDMQWKLLHSNDEDEIPDLTNGSHEHLFDIFVYYLAPPMKSFIFTIKGILSEIPFEKYSEDRPNKFARTTNLQNSLRESIKLFETKQATSLKKLYDQEVFTGTADMLLKTDQEEVAACCGNFTSLLGLYATELMEFLKLAETYEDARAQPRSWTWMKFWKAQETNKFTEEQRQNSTLNAALLDLQSQYRKPDHKAKIKPIETWSFKLWKGLKLFRNSEVQFGIRVGLGALVLSSLAFLPQTREGFNLWRIEWALTVYCIMMNKSLGGTTMTVKWRFIGTFFGAFAAYIVWITTDGNVYALCLTGVIISTFSFYIILFWKKNNPFGRFILLTYNLSALYSYSMTQQDSEDGGEGGDFPIIGEIAFHRVFAVSIGIIWALIMASCFLPNSARARLKNGLTILWLRLGVIWTSGPLDYNDEDLNLMGLKGEEGVNQLLAECEVLLKQAPLEFRLKGSFPEETYKSLLKCTSNIIDSFQNITLMIKVDPKISSNEDFVLKYIESERDELEHRIFLVFYMIASAMRLGFPLPTKPASTEHAKDRLLYKLSEIRSNSNDQMKLTNEDFILLYSYILVTSTISEELDSIIGLIKELLGDLTEDTFQLV